MTSIATIDDHGPDIPYAEVIGDPIAHSKSPLIHGFWLDALAIRASYRRCHVRPGQVAEYVRRRCDDPLWRGCNVTIPHKIAILDHVADPGAVRATIGAANSIARNAAGQLFATNTDAGGFYAPLADVDLHGQTVIVIGTGGAARAILFALAKMGVAEVVLLSRNALKASMLLASFGLKGTALPLGSPLPPARLLVNASPLGMEGQPQLDIGLARLPDDAIVYDIVYAPLVTELIAQAEGRGLTTIDGLEMLVGQAALAFELFFGVAPPRDRDGALRALLQQ